MPSDRKSYIYFHRSYRVAETVEPRVGRLLFVFVFVLEVLLIVFHPFLVQALVYSTRNVLTALGYHPTVVFWRMLYRSLPLIDLPTVYPTPLFSAGLFLVSILLPLVMFLIKKVPRMFAGYMLYLSVINASSAAFFILAPHKFPYDISIFSMLYTGTVVGLWILIPVILVMALYSLPTSIVPKMLFILFNVVYAMIFALIRYIFFLICLEDGSVIFMALFYFALGPLFDFVYLVGFYTYYVSNLSEAIRFSRRRWRWLY